MELVQSYDWKFTAREDTRLTTTAALNRVSSLRTRSVFTANTNSVTACPLRNPPTRNISRKTDLLYGENRRLLAQAYDTFVAAVLAKVIEEAKEACQRIEMSRRVALLNGEEPEMASAIILGPGESSPVDSAWTDTASSPTSPQSAFSGLSPASGSNYTSLVEALQVDKSQPSSPISYGSVPCSPIGAPSVAITAFNPLPDEAVSGTSIAERLAEPTAASSTTNVERLNTATTVDDTPQEKHPRGHGHHILKESLRWASKGKQKLLKAIGKRKDKYGKRDGSSVETSPTTPNTMESECPSTAEMFDGATDEAGRVNSNNTGSEVVHSGVLDAKTGLWDFTKAPTSAGSSSVASPGEPIQRRLSVKELFPPTIPGIATTAAAGGSSTDNIKAPPPKLSINTAAAPKLPPLEANVILSGTSSSDTDLRSPSSSELLPPRPSFQGPALEDEEPRGRGSKRRSFAGFGLKNVGEETGGSSMVSPTHSREWAARVLGKGGMAKRMREKSAQRSAFD